MVRPAQQIDQEILAETAVWFFCNITLFLFHSHCVRILAAMKQQMQLGPGNQAQKQLPSGQ